jgi:hypothetical protein
MALKVFGSIIFFLAFLSFNYGVTWENVLWLFVGLFLICSELIGGAIIGAKRK